MFSKIAETVSLTRAVIALAAIRVQIDERKNDKIPKQIKKLDELFKSSSSDVVRQYAGLYLAEGLLTLGKKDDAFDAIVKAFQIMDASAEINDLLWMNLTGCIAINPSMSLQDLERYSPSIESFLRKIQSPECKCKAYGSMARAFVFRDDFEQAQSYWEIVIHAGKAQEEGARQWIMMSEEQAQKWKTFREDFEARQSISMARPRMSR